METTTNTTMIAFTKILNHMTFRCCLARIAARFLRYTTGHVVPGR